MMTITSYAHRGRRLLTGWMADPNVRMALWSAGRIAGGFFLSAASLLGYPQTLVLGFVSGLTGWSAVLTALGGLLGYPIFWGSAGLQGVAWTLCGLLLALLVGDKAHKTPLLLPAGAALSAAVCGLAFQIWLREEAPVGMYILRTLLAAGSAAVFSGRKQDAVLQWLATALWVLALSQVAPWPWLSLGYFALGAVCLAGTFPEAALAGLAVDLAGITPVSMTAVACLVYFGRLVPNDRKWSRYLLPPLAAGLIMALMGRWDIWILPALTLGGLLDHWVPGKTKSFRRRGATAAAQVRLEMVAEVFSQTRQLLSEATEPPVDEAAILQRGADRACNACPARKSCRERDSVSKMPPLILHRPLLDGEDLPAACRKPGRLLSELHRSQEQLRTVRADRERQNEYRQALLQQYRFLSEYLQELSDELGKRGSQSRARFRPEVSAAANRPRQENGDRCLAFAGVGCRYYVLLCDGMGTGLGAVEEGKTAGSILKKLLTAGFPAEYALRSLNSLCALRSRAGAVTVDLAEVLLDTGRVNLYKWGAAPSWLLSGSGAEKIGTATPPPGLSVTEGRETAERLSLGRGEMLVLLSDGVGGEEALRGWASAGALPPGELAARLLKSGAGSTGDDATAVVIRLCTPEKI